MLGEGDRYEGNTQKASYYDTTLDLDVANIDKNYKNKWRTIYKAICECYFGEIKLFIRAFINICKKHPNDPQNIPTDIKNNSFLIALQESLYEQVLSIRPKSMIQKKGTGKT